MHAVAAADARQILRSLQASQGLPVVPLTEWDLGDKEGVCSWDDDDVDNGAAGRQHDAHAMSHLGVSCPYLTSTCSGPLCSAPADDAITVTLMRQATVATEAGRLGEGCTAHCITTHGMPDSRRRRSHAHIVL